MTNFLFFSLAKHQSLYFQRLLNETALTGKVVVPAQLPWPRPWKIRQLAGRIDWGQLVETRCQERQVKRKYAGGLFRLLLRLELLWIALCLQTLLDRERPRNLVVWNGSHRYCRLLLALRPLGTGTYFFENGLLPDTTTVDPQGVNYHNSVPRDAQFYFDYFVAGKSAGTLPVKLIPRKPRQIGVSPISLPESYIFIPFQDDRDTQVRLFSPWIGNMRELFGLGERLVREVGFTVVFKEHPSSRESYPDLHQRTSERLLFANGNSTQELIESSLFVMTINSTVGIESLLLGKPVLTLGKAFYNIPGLVMHADTAEAALQTVREYPKWPLDERIRKAFLRYMADEYCVSGGWKHADHAQLQRVAARMLNIDNSADHCQS